MKVAGLEGEIYERFHFFMDQSTGPKDIKSLLMKIKNENIGVSFIGDDITEDNLLNRLRESEQNFNIAYTPKTPLGLSLKVRNKQQNDTSINVWPRRSFMWEVDVCVETGKTKIAETIKQRVGGTYPYRGIRDLVHEQLSDNIILTASVFEIFNVNADFNTVIEAFRSVLRTPEDFGLPKGHVSVSLVNYDSLVVIIHVSEETQRNNSEFIVLVFHRLEKPTMACTGEIDYVYDILQLISCSKLLRKEEDQISGMEHKLLMKTDESITVLKDGDMQSRNEKLKKIMLDLVNLRREIVDMDRNVGEVIKYKDSLLDRLSGLDDIGIRNSAFNTAMYIVKDVEKDIEILNRDLSENIQSIRSIIRENLRSDTLLGVNKTYDGIAKEISIEMDMDNAIQSMHAMHSTLFILEFILFSEFFIGIIDKLPEFEHGNTETRLIYIAAAMALGISSAFILTYLARKTKLAEKLIKPELFKG